MRLILKKWKGMLLIVCSLFICLSATVFASELKTELTVSSDVENIESENQLDVIDLEESGKYVIEFTESDIIYTYSGEEIRPEFEVFCVGDVDELEDGEQAEDKTLLPEEFYTVEYLDNVNAGVATVRVTGIKEKGYSGTISAEFEIVSKSLENAILTLSSTKYVYDGKGKKPEVTLSSDGVILEEGVDYEIEYSDNREVGTASVVVTGKGNYTGSKKTTYIIVVGKPSVTTTPYYNKIKISWTKVTGASGYDVLRSKTKDKGYTCIKTITSGSTTSYTDTDVSFNNQYYYVIHAYRMVNGKKIYADFSAQKLQKVQPATPTISEISRSSATALNVSWNTISGASGYALYRSTSEKGTYTRIATIKSGKTVTYTDENCSCGKTYYYKVRAYRTVNVENYYGSYSSVKSCYTRPGKVSWNSIYTTYNSTSITLKWKKVPEASGYSIYRSTSKNGTYTKVKVITKNSTLSWKDTGLTKGVTYYYKIRAYKNMDQYSVYGLYSSVFTKSKAGWRYVNGYKLYYNSSGKLVKDVSSIIGKQSSYVIKINKKMNTVTVYAKDGKNGYIIPVKAFVCSTGTATPLGTFYTPQKLRWQTLDGPSYGQWCTRITGHILFHSVWYYKPSNTTLSVAQYNKLGTTASHGCVRLTAGDAKWIYDNCKLKTKVIIYNGSSVGPLGKPSAYKLPSWHTWDPTDPNVKSKCKAKGCH